MKKIIIQIIVFLYPLISFGQENDKSPEIKRNTIYFEALGQGIFNSFSIDRLYNVDKKIKTSFNTGLTTIPLPEFIVFGVPVSYNYILGEKNHHLELGLGITGMYIRSRIFRVHIRVIDANGSTETNHYESHRNDIYTYFTPKIGYRFKKNNGGLFFRLTFTPILPGINRIGGVEDENFNIARETHYFKSAAFLKTKFYPWVGISIGRTLKK
ncbi:MAG: hypothetical protein U0V04_00800 [Spirosomataceae bacterium]